MGGEGASIGVAGSLVRVLGAPTGVAVASITWRIVGGWDVFSAYFLSPRELFMAKTHRFTMEIHQCFLNKLLFGIMSFITLTFCLFPA